MNDISIPKSDNTTPGEREIKPASLEDRRYQKSKMIFSQHEIQNNNDSTIGKAFFFLL